MKQWYFTKEEQEIADRFDTLGHLEDAIMTVKIRGKFSHAELYWSFAWPYKRKLSRWQ
jgi:hypothetical protein